MVINLSKEELADVIETHRQSFSDHEYCTGCNWIGPPIGAATYKDNQYALHLAEMIQEATRPLLERRPSVWVDFESVLGDGDDRYVVVLRRQFQKEPAVGDHVIAGDHDGRRAHGVVKDLGHRIGHPRNNIRVDLDMTTFVSPSKHKKD